MDCIINTITERSAPHQHNEYEIIVFTRGEGTARAGEDFSVASGTILIIPPFTMHQCAFRESLDRIYIRGDFTPFFSFSVPVLVQDNTQQEGMMLAKMIYQNRYANPEYISALIDAFLHFLMQSIRTEDRIHIAVAQIIDRITDNYYRYDIDLQEFLKESGYAEDYIRAQFKKNTGKTPNEFLTEVRIRHACCLIDTYGKALPLTEIASKCGYTDYVYFSKKFKSNTGISPRTYMTNTFDL